MGIRQAAAVAGFWERIVATWTANVDVRQWAALPESPRSKREGPISIDSTVLRFFSEPQPAPEPALHSACLESRLRLCASLCMSARLELNDNCSAGATTPRVSPNCALLALGV
jgi:hypothetical protein